MLPLNDIRICATRYLRVLHLTIVYPSHIALHFSCNEIFHISIICLPATKTKKKINELLLMFAFLPINFIELKEIENGNERHTSHEGGQKRVAAGYKLEFNVRCVSKSNVRKVIAVEENSGKIDSCRAFGFAENAE